MGIELKIIPPNPFAEKAETAEGLTRVEMEQAIQWSLDNAPTPGFITGDVPVLNPIETESSLQVTPEMINQQLAHFNLKTHATAEELAKGPVRIFRKHVFPRGTEFDFGSAHRHALGLTPLANKVAMPI